MEDQCYNYPGLHQETVQNSNRNINILFFFYTIMEDWFLWFLCGCYLVGGLSIGFWFSEWRHRKDKKGTGRWDLSNRKFYGSGDQ